MPYTETRITTVEALLERHMGPVSAPAELWDRVHRAPSHRFDRRLAWALTTALLVLAAASGMYSRREGSRDEAAAFQALARGADSLELLSASAPAIRTWIRNQTGMEVPLEISPAVKLIGAQIVKPGTVEIAYRVGERRAVLVVSQATDQPDSRRHWTLRAKLYGSMSSLAWNRAGQRYILACAVPGDLQAACLICHAGGNTQWQTAVN